MESIQKNIGSIVRLGLGVVSGFFLKELLQDPNVIEGIVTAVTAIVAVVSAVIKNKNTIVLPKE